MENDIMKVNNMSRKNKFLIKFVLVLMVLDTMAGGSVINSATGVFTEEFNVSPTLINLITTISSVIAVPVAILVGRLAEKYNKKTLALIGFVFYLFGGVGPFFFSGIYGILFLRGIMGIGIGFLNPLSYAMISDAFVGDERAKMMGYGPAVGNVSGVVMSILGGVLVSIRYNFVFLGYLPLVIIPVLVYFILPKELFAPKNVTVVKSSSKEDNFEINKNISKEKLPLKIYGLLAVNIIVALASFTIMLRFAIYMTEEKLGNPVVISMIMAAMTVGGILSSVVFGFVYSKMKYFTVCIAWGLFVAACLFLYFMPTLASCAVAQLLFGIGLGLGNPFFFMVATIMVPKSKTTMAIAILNVGSQGAMFLSAFTTSVILFFMPGSTTRQQFLFPAGIFAILAIYAAWFAYKHRYDEIEITPSGPNMEA